jgi:Domain of unknown function (DUF5666)
MQKSYRFILSALLLGAFLLSACSGALPQQDDSSQSPAGSQSTEVVFTGTVQSVGGGQWLISGQQVDVDGSTSVDPNVKVGDIVKVEAKVSQDGAVLALKIESSRPDDAGANGNDSNTNDVNANDDNTNANDNANTNDNSNANSNDDNSNTAPAGPTQEAFGVVESITTNSITIGGVTYSIANFTEFKTLIAVGDQVKIHVIVNANGTLTIREIEKTTGTGIGNDNGNSNFNGSDDNSNGNSNSNDNGDDDNSNDNSNSNSNDDNGGDDNNSNDNG